MLPGSLVTKSLERLATYPSKTSGMFLNDGYAWGWNIGKYKQHKIYSHGGGYPGAHANVSFIPSEGLAVIVLNNDNSISRSISRTIVEIAYAMLVEQPLTQEDISQRLENLLNNYRQKSQYISDDQKNKAKRPWLLSLDKSAYLGTYHNDIMGKVHLTLQNNGNLVVRWGNLHATATPHKYQDVLRAELLPLSGYRITFELSQQNSVKGLILDDVSFTKKT